MRTAAIDPQVVDDRYGRLAASVIQRAILDGQTPGAHQASALAFLADRVSLGGWCAVAAVDVDIVRKRLIDKRGACGWRITTRPAGGRGL